MLDSGRTSATYYNLVNPDPDSAYISTLEPVAGEDYKDLVIHSGDDHMEVTTADGSTVRFSM